MIQGCQLLSLASQIEGFRMGQSTNDTRAERTDCYNN